MKLRDDGPLRAEVKAIVDKVKYRGGWPDHGVDAILDAVERHQQDALPAVEGATERQFCADPGCALHEAFAQPAPPPPVSGSPQAGEGEPRPWKCEACHDTKFTLVYGRAELCAACRTPSSPPVDPSDATRGEPTK